MKSFLVIAIVISVVSGCATTTSAPVGRPLLIQAPSATTGFQGHLRSYDRPQELVDPQELRVENDRSENYLRAVQFDQQAVRDAQRYQLEQQRQTQREVESWSRVLQDQLNAASWRKAAKEQVELMKRRQTQSEVRDLNRAIEQAGDNIVRALQRGR